MVGPPGSTLMSISGWIASSSKSVFPIGVTERIRPLTPPPAFSDKHKPRCEAQCENRQGRKRRPGRFVHCS